MKLTDEKRIELVKAALRKLTSGGIFTRTDCFGDTDDKPFKNWTRKLMLRFAEWELVELLPRGREPGEPSRFQVKNPDLIASIVETPEDISDLIWSKGPMAQELPDVVNDVPEEVPQQIDGPQPFVPPTNSEPLTSSDVGQALQDTVTLLRHMGELLIWMKDTIHSQGKKINEMHAILEQLK